MMGKLAMLCLTLAYPIVVYLCLGRFEPRWLAFLLLALALLRLFAGSRQREHEARPLWTRDPMTIGLALAALMLALVTGISNSVLPVKLYPVAVNALALLVFALSLRYPPSMIERFARIREPQLPPEAVRYTYRVTQIWCVFFVVNGSIAAWTAAAASAEIWTLYNGLIAYLLMGLLFVGEYLVRRRVRARHA